MPGNIKTSPRGGLEGEKGTKLSAKGEIPSIIVFSDRKHVDYIYNIINCVEESLKENGFKVYLLSDETSPDEHLGKKFEELAEECMLGVIILDGFRPNIIYEYGLLRGKNRQIILLQDKKAFVAVKSFYSIPESPTEAVIKNKTGLTKTQFKNLKKPPIEYFSHLSDRLGTKTIVVDCAARSDSPDFPKNKIDKELKKLKPKIVEKYGEQSLKPLENISPEYFQKFQKIAFETFQYYAEVSSFDVMDIERVINEIQKLEESSGINMPSQIYSTIGFLYKSLAEKTEWKNVDKIIEYFNRAIGMYRRILEFEIDPVLRSDAYGKIGSCYFNISEYRDRKKNSKKAIKEIREALKIYTLKQFPMQYAATQNNLGTAFGELSRIEDKAENSKKAIKAYREALKVYTLKQFPADYAMTQMNLGIALETLGEVEDKAENCKKAIKAYREALKVVTKEEFPERYHIIRKSLKRLLVFCRGK